MESSNCQSYSVFTELESSQLQLRFKEDQKRFELNSFVGLDYGRQFEGSGHAIIFRCNSDFLPQDLSPWDVSVCFVAWKEISWNTAIITGIWGSHLSPSISPASCAVKPVVTVDMVVKVELDSVVADIVTSRIIGARVSRSIFSQNCNYRRN